jgi:hypothetical protein
MKRTLGNHTPASLPLLNVCKMKNRHCLQQGLVRGLQQHKHHLPPQLLGGGRKVRLRGQQQLLRLHHAQGRALHHHLNLKNLHMKNRFVLPGVLLAQMSIRLNNALLAKFGMIAHKPM